VTWRQRNYQTRGPQPIAIAACLAGNPTVAGGLQATAPREQLTMADVHCWAVPHNSQTTDRGQAEEASTDIASVSESTAYRFEGEQLVLVQSGGARIAEYSH
jgi:hypothetical protein